MNSAQQWIAFAEQDLAAAKHLWPKHFAATCFHLQQAWEKSFKAVLIARGEGLQKTHYIRHLATKTQAPKKWSEYYDMLSQFYILTRYPTSTQETLKEQYTTQDVEKLLQTTQEVLTWTKQQIA